MRAKPPHRRVFMQQRRVEGRMRESRCAAITRTRIPTHSGSQELENLDLPRSTETGKIEARNRLLGASIPACEQSRLAVSAVD